MTARDKFIVVALVGLMAIVSAGAVFIDQAERTGIVPANGGTYIEGVVGQPQYLEPILAATDIDEDVVRLVFSGLVDLYQGSRLLDWLMDDRGRLVFGYLAFHLHFTRKADDPASGLTPSWKCTTGHRIP